MPDRNSNHNSVIAAGPLDFLPGQLLVSNPRNPRDDLYQSVILLVEDELASDSDVIGVRVNDPLEDITVGQVAWALGIRIRESEPLWFGGRKNQNRIHIVHTLDWSSSSTLMLTADIGVTSDVSVLMAIADQAMRPRHFRACSGHISWRRDRLCQEIRGDHVRESAAEPAPILLHHYELVPATPELTFQLQGPEQWRQGLEAAAQAQASRWMGS